MADLSPQCAPNWTLTSRCRPTSIYDAGSARRAIIGPSPFRRTVLSPAMVPPRKSAPIPPRRVSGWQPERYTDFPMWDQRPGEIPVSESPKALAGIGSPSVSGRAL
jgi:hypothetical protein